MVHVAMTPRGKALAWRSPAPPVSAAHPESAVAPGFTLAELVIVIVVVSVSALVFTGMFREAVRTYELLEREKDLLQEARYAEHRITSELMRVSAHGGILQARPRELTILTPDSSLVAFSWSGVRGSDLVLRRNGEPRPLASDVDSLAFSYFSGDGRPVPPGADVPIRRVGVFLRLAREGHRVELAAGALLRSL